LRYGGNAAADGEKAPQALADPTRRLSAPAAPGDRNIAVMGDSVGWIRLGGSCRRQERSRDGAIGKKPTFA